MQTSLDHLPEHKQAQLREITAIIVKAVDPETVTLFGSHAQAYFDKWYGGAKKFYIDAREVVFFQNK